LTKKEWKNVGGSRQTLFECKDPTEKKGVEKGRR